MLISPPTLSESASVFFVGELIANFDNNVHIIARYNLFYPCNIVRASADVILIQNN